MAYEIDEDVMPIYTYLSLPRRMWAKSASEVETDLGSANESKERPSALPAKLNHRGTCSSHCTEHLVKTFRAERLLDCDRRDGRQPFPERETRPDKASRFRL